MPEKKSVNIMSITIVRAFLLVSCAFATERISLDYKLILTYNYSRY
jgi:hypothetical protein